MFFPPRRPGSGKHGPGSGVPIMTGLPGLNLNLSVDHIQLLGTLAIIGLSRRPGFKEEIEQFVEFLRQVQAAAEAITVQMEAVQQQFDKAKAKVSQRQETAAKRSEANPYLNPFLQHLFKFM